MTTALRAGMSRLWRQEENGYSREESARDRERAAQVMKKVQKLWNRLWIRGIAQAAQSSIVEEICAAVVAARPAVRGGNNFFEQQRKDINEYVETESAW